MPGVTAINNTTTPMQINTAADFWDIFMPQRENIIISIKNGKNTLPKYAISLETIAKGKVFETESIKYPVLHTATETNKRERYKFFFRTIKRQTNANSTENNATMP